jgi:hypothetical protein
MAEDAATGSRWQWVAGALAKDIVGVPVGPVCIGVACSLFMLAMCRCGASQRGRDLRGRVEGRISLDAAGQPRGNFLEQPAVTIGIAERGKRQIAAAPGVRAVGPNTAEQNPLPPPTHLAVTPARCPISKMFAHP